MTRVYLDHQASTPLLPPVWNAMEPFLLQHFGAASSLHQEGLKARNALERAREQLVPFLGAEHPREVLFTSGFTESANLAIKGAAWAARGQGNHIVLSAIEHPAVEQTVAWLEENGFSATRVPVDRSGRLDPAQLKSALTPSTTLVCVHHGNHDLGTMQALEEIGELSVERGIPLFVDASSSAGWLPLEAQRWQASYIALSAQRFGGPKGGGILYKSKRSRLVPLLHGGDQEEGKRAGTVNVAAAVGAGAAAELVHGQLQERATNARQLQLGLWEHLRQGLSHWQLNGPSPGGGRLPNHLSLSLEFVEGEGVMLLLDMRGFAVASGTSCVSKNLKVSPVLEAIGLDPALAQGNIIVTLGPDNNPGEVERFTAALVGVVDRLRQMSPSWEEFQQGHLVSLTAPRHP